MITKTELMAIVASGRSRESFEHSILGQFDISAMRLVASQIGQPIVVPLELIIDHIRETRVFEEARILALNMEDCLFDPGIMITTIRESDGFKLQTITTQFDKIEEPGKWETD